MLVVKVFPSGTNVGSKLDHFEALGFHSLVFDDNGSRLVGKGFCWGGGFGVHKVYKIPRDSDVIKTIDSRHWIKLKFSKVTATERHILSE